ncbi:MAG: signal peptidase II [Roseburia sp.]|nr:signal peptidase II [Roseburia sp.]
MTLVSLFAADSLIKYGMEKHLRPEETRQLLHGRVVIRKYHNTGAMLNVAAARQPAVALVSLVFSAFMTGVFAATLGMRGRRALKLGLALLLGGAYSNTYDRLRRKYVVDYFSFRFPPAGNSQHTGGMHTGGKRGLAAKFQGRIERIVFNLSDFGIIIGAMLITVGSIRR